MTACKNFAKGGKAGRVITAALVATLSVGAPVVALATTGAEGGIDMLVAGDVDNVIAGQIIEWKDQDGKVMSGTELVADGTNAKYIVPTKVMPLYGDEAVSVQDDTTYDFNYYVAAKDGGIELPDGTKVKALSDPANAGLTKGVGTYYVGIAKAGTGKGDVDSMLFMKYTVVNNSLADARITDAKGKDVDFTYTGAAITGYKFMVGDKDLRAGTDYAASIYYSNGTPATLQEASDYIIRLSGKGAYAGETVDIKVTVNKLDLSEASLTVVTNQDATTGTDLPTSTDLTKFALDGTPLNPNSGLGQYLKIAFDASQSSQVVAAEDTAGAFAYTLTVKDSDNTNITGKATVIATRYDELAYFEYDGDEVTAGATVDLTTPGSEKFDTSKIVVAESDDKDAKAVDFDITYTDKDKKAVTADQLTVPGDYEAKITAKSSDYAFGGSFTIKFNVAASVISDSSVYVLYDGDVVDADEGIKKVYDGVNVMDAVSVTAYDEDKKEIPASELVLTYVDEDGKEVSEVTNAGKYTLKVSLKDGSSYKLEKDQKVAITIDAVNISGTGNNAEVRFTNVLLGDTKNALAYTGDAVVPTFEYKVNGTDEWISLPASAYTLTFYKVDASGNKSGNALKSVSEKGTYRAVLSDVADDVNYTATRDSYTMNFTITDEKIFGDVSNTEWYYNAVYTANQLGYMTGYAGTHLFGPTASLTRAQAVVVLYNMAGGKGGHNDIAPGSSYDKDQVYTTGFADVDADGANAWATYAIKWAKDTGLTTGYGDGNFGPNDSISRAQFVTMLARYAQLVGNYEAVDNVNEVLAAYNDGDAVDEWFKESVAWAVVNDVIGVDVTELNPNSSVERAQVAAMAVRYQPEAL